MFPAPAAHKRATNKEMLCAAYVRVSTRQQDLSAQKTAISRAAEARGDHITRWFEEKIGGHKLDRTELSALRLCIRRGEFRKLYVFSFDRLSRGGIRDTFAVIKELQGFRCTIATVNDPFDLDGPAGDVVLAVMAWAAQMERKVLSDRISAARLDVEAKGGRWGRPRRIDPGTLDRAKALYDDGKTHREIAIALKIPRSTVQRALAQKGHYAERAGKGGK